MGVALLLIVGILVLEDMYKYLKTFIDKGASLATLLTYYAFVIPSCLHTVLPIAFLISILYVLNEMQTHHEVIALRAAGLTVFRITRSFWFIAVALVFGMVVFNISVLPYSADRVQSIMRLIDYNEQKKNHAKVNAIGMEYNLNFYNAKARRLWFMRNFSWYTYRGSYATVCSFNASNQEVSRIEAKEVRFDDSRREWIFNEGKHWSFDLERGIPSGFVNFKEYVLQCEDAPRLMQVIHKPIKNLTINELKLILDFVPRGHERFLEHQVQYYSILSSPLICFIVVLLAIPFSLVGVRNNTMVGIAKAVGLFFCYYILSSLGRLLGAQGFLSPLMATWLPNFSMLFIGIYLYRQLAPR